MFWKHSSVAYAPPLTMPYAGGVIVIPKIDFDCGIKIHQTRFKYDRAAKYAFVLAVEDCVRGALNAASRETTDTSTTIAPLADAPAHPEEDQLKNGSIMSVFLSGIQSFEPYAALAKGEFLDSLDLVADTVLGEGADE